MFVGKTTAHVRTIARRSVWMALTLLVVFLSSTLLLSAGSASAATSFTLRGPVFTADGVRVPGSYVNLYRWNGRTWGNPITRTRTNAEGSYTIYNVPTGPSYLVRAHKFYPDCTAGISGFNVAWYSGESRWFATSSTTTGFRAPVYIFFDRWWTC
jgi:hypothetical protein